MKIVVVCPALEMGGTGNRIALEREVRRSMERKGGSVNSASGMTAALAINCCERLGLSYSVQAFMTSGEARYFVQRLDTTGLSPQSGAQREEKT